jgi:replicative superfamily II helicase
MAKIIDDIVTRRKLAKQFPSLRESDTQEEKLLIDFLNDIEFDAIHLWNPKNDEEKQLFAKICNRYVEIAQTLIVPSDEMEKIFHVFRLMTFGYLGDRWEVVHRYLKDKQSYLEVNCDCEDWNERLFKTIYMAVYYILLKDKWENLESAIGLINKLRSEQQNFENKMLDNVKNKSASPVVAFEIASFYHLAKCVDLLGTFQLEGKPTNVNERLDFHFDQAINLSDKAGLVELGLISRLLKSTFQKMVNNSIWMVAYQINPSVKSFVETLVKSQPPIIEFMWPQRYSILERGLLDASVRSIVVNLPTSSGKTLVAEFRILQAINHFKEVKGWVAYVVPTKALVNQITLRLKKDLAVIDLKVEKVSGALDIDAYETKLINNSDFDILVMTPEKFSMILRRPDFTNTLGLRPLALVVVDEAHNIETWQRGINLETLLAMIKKDCPTANYLLMTPFLPNTDEIAKWLAPTLNKSINLGAHFWKPNHMVIGAYYSEKCKKEAKIKFKPLVTLNETLVTNEPITITEFSDCPYTKQELNTKYKLTALVASKLYHHENVLILAGGKPDSYLIANILWNNIPFPDTLDPKVKLVRDFVAAELGDEFPLVKYLEKGIGIHHAGLPEEIRSLMETLMEKGLLKYLIATTTIAQGINFQISTILMAAYNYPISSYNASKDTSIPQKEFWNLVGRAGRVYKNYPGTVGIAVKGGINSEDSKKVMIYVRQNTASLISNLVAMVDIALKESKALDLKALYREPAWSTFLQYIAHLYNETENLTQFIDETEMGLKRTLGYNQLTEENKRILLNSVKEYAKGLNKGITKLADATGFCPETINAVIAEVKELPKAEWAASALFQENSNSMKSLVGIMLRTPEVEKQMTELNLTGRGNIRFTISNFISDWVSGKDISYLSKKYYGDELSDTSTCVSAIYSHLINAATWSLSAFQKLAQKTLDYDSLSEDEKRKLANIPAMVYYGVDSDEAILLRKAGVPRSISKNLGYSLRQELGEDLYNKNLSDISAWLKQLSDGKWQQAVSSGKKITGKDYKQVWAMLSGEIP